ncbi:hypothetical protein [Peterkaempfera griseoplana]|uniref:hypothetical protein n=1 Tax=Peterkaempfera griseoplana TaxID=66896 RepID=UPI0006E27F15|nr:hypothetical protein [Peterkaempfera griseoplana]
MRNRRLAAVLTGALLAGTLTAGAGVAIATADRKPAPVSGPAAPGGPNHANRPSPSGRTDAVRTVDVLASLGNVTRGVRDLVSNARRGADTAEVQQNATQLGNAAQELLDKAGARPSKPAGQGMPTREGGGLHGRASGPSVEQAVTELKKQVRALLSAVRSQDQGSLAKVVESVASSLIDLVRAVVDAVDTPVAAAVPAGPAS